MVRNLLFFLIFSLFNIGCELSDLEGYLNSGSEAQTPEVATKPLSINNLNISGISTTGFTVTVGFSGDENNNASVTLYYCNKTDTAYCDPLSGSTTNLNRAGNLFSTSISGLSSPNDPGDQLNILVQYIDSDGTNRSQYTGQITLSPSSDSISVGDIEIVDISGSGFAVMLSYTGDENNNSSATFYYCNETVSPGCNATSGDSISLAKYGADYFAEQPTLPAGYSSGDQVNCQIIVSDSDGSSNGTLTGSFSLVTGLEHYPNSSDLVALWKMDEANYIQASNVVDHLGLHNGTLTTLNGAVNKSIAGKVGNAISFDGTDDTVIIPGHSDFDKPAGAKMTYMGWLNRQGSLSGDVPMAISYGASNASLGPAYSSTNIFYYDGGSGHGNIGVSFGIGEWHHFAITFDSGNGAIFWDGVLVSTFSGASDSSRTALEFRLASDNWGFYSPVILDEVSFWKRALTADEVNEIYINQN